MKHHIALICICGTLALLTQNVYSQSLSAGVNAGVDISTANTSEDLSLSSRKGMILGAAAEATLFQPLTFRVGVQYVEKGFEVTTSNNGIEVGNYDFSYLDFPISLKLSLGDPAFDVFVFGGTTIGTLLSATKATDGASQDVKDQLNTAQLSLDLGAGVGIELVSHLSLITQATYSFGLTDAAKEQNSLLSTSSWKARELKLTTGLYFILGQ